VSWIVLLVPGLSLNQAGAGPGIFVKNYIDQSQEFSLCAVALLFPILALWRDGKRWQAALLCALALAFLLNMIFDIVSRTAMVTMPIMLAVFALLHFRLRTNLVIFCIATALASLAWTVSPQLRRTADRFATDYLIYKENLNQPTSIGYRLEFWTKSLRFFAEAPLIGHGTGSTRGLFEKAAVGSTTFAAGEVIGNPHNQTRRWFPDPAEYAACGRQGRHRQVATSDHLCGGEGQAARNSCDVIGSQTRGRAFV